MENDSLTSTYDQTYLAYEVPTTGGIISIFPFSSAITSASGESNPFRWTLRYPAAIFRVGFNLEPAIHWTPTAFVAITTMDTAVAPSPAPFDTARGAGSKMDSTGNQITDRNGDVTIPALSMYYSYRQVMECAPLLFPTASVMNAFMNVPLIRIGFAQFF